VAPIPKASVITAVVVNPGAFLSRRSASFKSAISSPLTVFGVGGESPTLQVSFQIRMSRRVVSDSLAALLSCNTQEDRFGYKPTSIMWL